VSCLNSLNVLRRSQDSAGSMVSEAAFRAGPANGQATGRQVRYREVAPNIGKVVAIISTLTFTQPV
jgi:hypothetical protein